MHKYSFLCRRKRAVAEGKLFDFNFCKRNISETGALIKRKRRLFLYFYDKITKKYKFYNIAAHKNLICSNVCQAALIYV